MKAEDVLKTILETAATMANEQTKTVLPKVDGQVFVPNPLASTKHGFCLTYTEVVLQHVKQEELTDIRSALADIATRAVRAAIVEHGDEFWGLVTGLAKQGINFFAEEEEGPKYL